MLLTFTTGDKCDWQYVLDAAKRIRVELTLRRKNDNGFGRKGVVRCEERQVTIRELVVKLQKFDQNLPVYVADWNEGYAVPTPLKSAELCEEESFAIEWGKQMRLPKRLQFPAAYDKKDVFRGE